MKSSRKKKRKSELYRILPTMSKAQKFFRTLNKLGITSTYQYGDQHLTELRRWAERVT